MKLKLTKMPKVPKQFLGKKTRQAKSIAARKPADELADTYLAAKEQEGVIKGRLERANAAIKAVARSSGIAEGKDTVLYGDEFKVGFKTCDGTPEVDILKMKTVLSRKGGLRILNEVLKSTTVQTVDEKKLEKLVAAGEITVKELNQFLKPAKSFERLVCERIKQ